MLSYMNLVYAFPFYLKLISILSFHLRVAPRSSLFTLCCLVKRACTSILPILSHDWPISSSFIILWGVQVMKPLVTQFFWSNVTFSFLGPNICFYESPILKDPQPVYFAKCERLSFTQQDTHNSVYWIFIFLNSQREDERFWSEWHKASPDFSLRLIPACVQFWFSSEVSKYLRFVKLFTDFI